MERAVQRQKARVQEHPRVPNGYEDLETLPDKFTKTFDGERFLISNVGLEGGDRILLFSSMFGLDLLRKAKTWSGDGTFSVTPLPFYQLYTIMAEIDGHSYPAAYSLLPNKRSPTYHAMFGELKSNLLPTAEIQLNLDHFLIDFECPVMKEIRAVFGSSLRITGCYVHFRRNLWKRLGSAEHMLSLYCKQKSFHVFINCIAGLAFVPPIYVPDYYTELLEKDLGNVLVDMYRNADLSNEAKDSIRESIKQYLDYIESNYVGKEGRTGWTNPCFLPEVWNQYDYCLGLEQRTTNRNEVFHSVLRKAIPHNASLWSVMDEIKTYEAKV